MFTQEDILEIVRLFPPERVIESDSLDDLPPLILSLSGEVFLTQKHVLHKFNQAVQSNASRIPVSSLSQELSVDHEVILKLVRASPELVFFSADSKRIITKMDRDALWTQVQNMSYKRPVELETFAKDNDISLQSLEASIPRPDSPPQWNAPRFETGPDNRRYIVSPMYLVEIQDKVRSLLDDALAKAEHRTIAPHDLPGTPPTWFILRQVQSHLRQSESESGWSVYNTTDSVECIPKESILRTRDEEIAQLLQGSIPCIDLQQFAERYPDLYPTVRDVENEFSNLSMPAEIEVMGPTAISRRWLEQFVKECLHSIYNYGYADITTKILEGFPFHCQGEVLTKMRQLLSGYQGAQILEIHFADKFALTKEHHKSMCSKIYSESRHQARRHWEGMNDGNEPDPKFQATEVIGPSDASEPGILLHAILKEVAKDAELEYLDEITSLEIKDEELFSQFWNDRVPARVSIYTQGLNSIDDPKLNGQLCELLCGYLLKELVPDTLTRARSQGLTRSRKTRKNMQKLEAKLKQGLVDLPKAVTAIEKFGKKQGVPELDNATLTDSKALLVNEMTRRMQKQSEGPVLFLTLVTVLLARQRPGVVYATGKFAPKLMKLLKQGMKSEDYEKLEKWKDLAKTGSLTAEDKERMKGMAGD
ncbi:hypothetical protein GQ43DRAFT_195286 [Delitschia confertaspora ATCC 74209]|uniref:Uncharacterized protein n=1 Tax=Delitschia confertaspora ATCC 74209 TaxID=1513339 RepID=A0A9P4JGQ9_9PLEO|nr:hypothetical protein GQ43DRAFT_195286 [Delitschia confertaspora ATCC 74209]